MNIKLVIVYGYLRAKVVFMLSYTKLIHREIINEIINFINLRL